MVWTRTENFLIALAHTPTTHKLSDDATPWWVLTTLKHKQTWRSRHHKRRKECRRWLSLWNRWRHRRRRRSCQMELQILPCCKCGWFPRQFRPPASCCSIWQQRQQHWSCGYNIYIYYTIYNQSTGERKIERTDGILMVVFRGFRVYSFQNHSTKLSLFHF